MKSESMKSRDGSSKSVARVAATNLTAAKTDENRSPRGAHEIANGSVAAKIVSATVTYLVRKLRDQDPGIL
jgi:hypothetical protein